MKNFKKFENRLFVMEFSVPGDAYFPEVDYMCVSSTGNEKDMNTLINHFITHNQAIYSVDDMIIMPKKTYMTIFNPIICEIVDFNKKLKNMDEWSACDDQQWVRYLGKHEYEFFEIGYSTEDNFFVYHDTVNVSDFLSDEIKEDKDFEQGVDAIRQYGYGLDIPNDISYREQKNRLVSELVEVYGEEQWEQIVAEILFEVFYQNTIDARFDTEEDAVQYVISLFE